MNAVDFTKKLFSIQKRFEKETKARGNYISIFSNDDCSDCAKEIRKEWINTIKDAVKRGYYPKKIKLYCNTGGYCEEYQGTTLICGNNDENLCGVWSKTFGDTYITELPSTFIDTKLKQNIEKMLNFSNTLPAIVLQQKKYRVIFMFNKNKIVVSRHGCMPICI